MAASGSRTCPSLETLEVHLAGGCPDPTIGEHLARCPTCRRHMEEMRENEALMGQLLAADLGAVESDPAHARCAPTGSTGIGRYETVEEIHRGGQGIVYKAIHAPTKRTVALKVILHGTLATSRQRRRFEREAELVSSLRHENIVTLYDSGVTADGRHYLVTEYIEGIPLDEYVRSSSRGRSTDALLRLFAEVCEAVSYAHQRGVIHRDLKPSNILVTKAGRPRVLDFGLAKLIRSSDDENAAPSETVAGEFTGTLAYAAPEQVAGDPSMIDVRTDVYALGVILYEMLTHQHPYRVSGPVAAVVRAITDMAPSPPSKVEFGIRNSEFRTPHSASRGGRHINHEIDAIVLKALAKDPQRRYQSAEHLRREIDRYLRGLPVDAKRDSSWYLIAKLVRRHRAPVAVVVAFVVLVLGFGVMVWSLYQESLVQMAKVEQNKVFWEDTLASVEPSKKGEDVTVREVFDEAERWVDRSLDGRPELEAYARLTIGNVFRNLGLYDKAERHLRKSLALRRQLFGESHGDVAQSLNSLALLQSARGEHDQAKQIARQALDTQRRLFGDNHPAVAMTLNNFAYILRDSRDYAAAERAYLESLKIRRARFGDDHPDVAMVCFRLGELQSLRDNDEAAVYWHRKALAARRKALPENHPDLARSLLALGSVLARQGQLDEATAFLEEAIRIRRTNLSGDNWKISEAQIVLASCWVESGEYERAEPVLLAGYATIQSARGDDDAKTRAAIEQIVRLYERWQRPQQAAEWNARRWTTHASDSEH